MSVYRNKKSPYWQFDFQIERHRFYGSTETTDEREAEAYETIEKQKARDLITEAKRSGRGPLTLGAACDRWWTEHGKYLADESDEALLGWIKDQLGANTFLHAISDDDIAKMVTARRESRVRAGCDDKGKQLWRPITPRTINKTIDLVRRVMRRARDNWKATIFNEPVWKNHRLAQVKRKVREITAAEDARLDQAETPEYIKLRRFAEVNGLRRRAMLLTWPQVDFELALYRIKSKGGTWREIPMTPETYQILWSCRGHHPIWVFTFVAKRSRRCPWSKELYVKGARYPITYYGLGSEKRKTWAAAAVDARIHDLRHTTGMRTLRTTGNLKLVQTLLGHAKIATTADFYTDANLEDLRGGMTATENSNPRPQLAIERKIADGVPE